MFETDIPKYKIGCLQPGAIIDNHPFEFYRLAPPGIMLVMVGVGLKEFSRGDVERVFTPLDRYLDQLMEREVDVVIQHGVPLPLLIGIEAHDRMMAHMAEYTGLPVYSAICAIIRSCASSPIRIGSGTPCWITISMSRSMS